MVVLDGTIVNVALPYIQRALGFSGTGLEWVVNAYALTFGGCCCSAAAPVTSSADGDDAVGRRPGALASRRVRSWIAPRSSWLPVLRRT
jgi:MFS family permease